MLSELQRNEFQSRGFLLPGAECSLARQLPAPETFARLLATPGLAEDAAVDRHLDDPLTYLLCTTPAIVERVAALLGPDLLLWHSRYFDKPADGPPIPWHQDAPFWAMEPMRCVSAWLALDNIARSNGCVFVVPGSNKVQLPQIPSQGTGRFGRQADISTYDVSAAIPLELARGEFFLFDSWLLHCSGRNTGGQSRLGLSMQFIPPEVKLGLERLQARIPSYGVQVVRGVDRLRLNPQATAPK
jgi:phytanoyl-CoA hydroxylase